MKTIIFRCDSSSIIGSGHLIRCRSLAKILQSMDCKCYFVCADLDGNINSSLAKEFPVFTLPPILSSEDNLNAQRQSKQLSSCSRQADDASATITLLLSQNIKDIQWFVVDNYALDAVWESSIRDYCKDFASNVSIFAIDDLPGRSHSSDAVLDQNIIPSLPSEFNYQIQDISDSVSFCGPHFGLMSSEYRYVSKVSFARKQCRRVLIYFGNADCSDLITTCLQGLIMHSAFQAGLLTIDIVLGSNSRLDPSLITSHNTNSVINVWPLLPSLVHLQLQADLAIGACGSSSWERLALRLPCLAVQTAKNQESISYLLNSLNLHCFIGESSSLAPIDFYQAFDQALNNWDTFSSVAPLSDGFGSHRISHFIAKNKTRISVRDVAAHDEILLFHWANDFLVRKNSFNSSPILLDEHRAWFSQTLENPDRHIFIATNQYDCPVGQIRFDQHHNVSSTDFLEFYIDLSVDPCFRGEGLSLLILENGIRSLQSTLGQVKLKLIADVLTHNLASLALFRKFGFLNDYSSSQSNAIRLFCFISE
jgi:UDP-2,4-diacetamido-2,4,6-trideoxy-beta-L-altropyranose hydrolase